MHIQYIANILARCASKYFFEITAIHSNILKFTQVDLLTSRPYMFNQAVEQITLQNLVCESTHTPSLLPPSSLPPTLV